MIIFLSPILFSYLTFTQPAISAESVLRVCDDVSDPPSLNPYQVFSEKGHTLIQQMLEGLVRFDSAGRVEPALAESWKRLDDRTVRFHLRKGVEFHNGEPFNAAAVKFSLERFVAPETHYVGYGFIKSLSSVDIIDDYTVDVKTNGPDGLLLNRLAAWIHVVPPKYFSKVGDSGFAENPIGTGPFKFEKWTKGKEISMIANKKYWTAGYPNVDRLIFTYVPVEEQTQALLDGQIDLLTELPGTQTATAMKTGKIHIVKKPSFYAVTSALNPNRPYLSDIRVRKALNYAIDKEELIRYDVFGNARVLATVTMDGEQGHNSKLTPYPHNLATARRLLKDAGYEKGFTLKAAVKTQGERAAKIIAKQLEKIHVKLDLHVYTDKGLYNTLISEPWDMFIAGCPDPMSHSYFIQSIFLYSDSPYSIVKDKDYDARLERMVSTIDDSKRQEQGEELDQYLYDQALMLFMYQRIKTYGLRNGVTLTPAITGMPYFFDAEKAAAQ